MFGLLICANCKLDVYSPQSSSAGKLLLAEPIGLFIPLFLPAGFGGGLRQVRNKNRSRRVEVLLFGSAGCDSTFKIGQTGLFLFFCESSERHLPYKSV